MNAARYLNFAYSQENYILLPVGNTSGGELELYWGCKKLTYKDYLDALERMAQAKAERARILHEAVTMVPTFAVKRKREKYGKWQK